MSAIVQQFEHSLALPFFGIGMKTDLKNGEYKDVCSFSPVRTPKLQLLAEQLLTGECWIPPEKIPHVQGQRRSPSKTVGEAKSCLESNPISARDTQRLKQTLCTPAPRDHTETDTELCLSISCGGMGQQWTPTGRGSGCSRPGYGISPLGGGRH